MPPLVVYSFTRERAALIAPRFPILTLDDRRQSTGLGYIFDIRWLLPGESIVSICGNSRARTEYQRTR